MDFVIYILVQYLYSEKRKCPVFKCRGSEARLYKVGLFIFSSKNCLEDSFSTFYKSGQGQKTVPCEQLAGVQRHGCGNLRAVWLSVPVRHACPTPTPREECRPRESQAASMDAREPGTQKTLR